MDNQTPQANPKKLFIGNLPYSATEDQLSNVFAPYGEIVDLKIITDKFSGRSKGIAFIEYASEDQAQAAIEGVNETEMDGRKLIVNIARPPQPRENRGFGGGRGGFGGDRRGGGRTNRY